MKNSIFDLGPAMEAFLDTPAAFSCRRNDGKSEFSILSSFLDNGFDGGIIDESTGSEIAAASFQIARSGRNAWPLLTPPQTGDIVTVGERRYAVRRVSADDEIFTLDIREV
jgi:hypothetical protein